MHSSSLRRLFPLTPTTNFCSNAQLKLVFFGGKGGVGKTTLACATALKVAQENPNHNYLIVSTDPAHSLNDCLGDVSRFSNLSIVELNANQSYEAFISKHKAHFAEIAKRGTLLDEDDISRFLDLSLPGVDELMALLKINDWVVENKYERAFIDTAPTGHTLNLFGLPKVLREWIGAMDTMLAKHRFMVHQFQGSYQKDEIDRFLLDWNASLIQLEALLHNPSECCFVPVMIAERMSRLETEDLITALESSGIKVAEIVVNKSLLRRTSLSMSHQRKQQLIELEAITQNPLFDAISLFEMPLMAEEMRTAHHLLSIWDLPLMDAAIVEQPVTKSGKKGTDFRVDAPISTKQLKQKKLIFFGGKGGVGKTTMACATAIKMAELYPEKKVLLFSIDPAHSLADCLELPLGDDPISVLDNLSACEINSAREFQSLKEMYTEELEQFMGNILPEMDLVYDREVMTRILDLAPSGLDEILALDQILYYRKHNIFDIFVIDAAPTGHLIRFLEMPEIINQWLKTFFGLFLKYKSMFRLPKVTDRMIELSKNLKSFRTLLVSREDAALFGVSTATSMAFEETKDLVESAKRIELHMPVLCLNMLTEASEDNFSRSISDSEAHWITAYKEYFKQIQVSFIYRKTEPRGLPALQTLSRKLYST